MDAARIEEVGAKIRALHARDTLRTALAVGQVLLESFYANDLAEYRSRRRRHTSLRALARQGGLGVSGTYLWTCLAVLDQVDQLPPEVGSSLSLAHHRLLLGVPVPAVRTALAADAVAEGWSCEVLRDRIRELRDAQRPGLRRGRPPVSARVRAIDALEVFEKHARAALADTSRDPARPDELESLRARLAPLVDLADDLLDQLEQALGAADTSPVGARSVA